MSVVITSDSCICRFLIKKKYRKRLRSLLYLNNTTNENTIPTKVLRESAKTYASVLESHFYHNKSLGRLWTINQSVISKVFVNPFMHNVEKYSGILFKSCGVHKFDHLSTVYMKEWSFDALDDDTAKNTVISPNFPKILKSISRNWQITRNHSYKSFKRKC